MSEHAPPADHESVWRPGMIRPGDVYVINGVMLPGYHSGVGPASVDWLNTDCQAIPGPTPRICPKARPQLPPELLPVVEGDFRRLRLVKPDETVLWVGRPTGLEDTCMWHFGCPCFGREESGAAAEARSAQARGSTPPALRLTVDLKCKTITLDGEVMDCESENALRWVKILAAHPGKWISATELCTHDEELLSPLTHRWLPKLPAKVKALINSKPGTGSRIRL